MSGDRNRCSSCNAAVLWVQTTSGKHMPVDPHIDPAGNLALDYSTRPPTAHLVRPGSQPGTRTSHFATCPAAAAHRNRPLRRRPDAVQLPLDATEQP